MKFPIICRVTRWSRGLGDVHLPQIWDLPKIPPHGWMTWDRVPYTPKYSQATSQQKCISAKIKYIREEFLKSVLTYDGVWPFWGDCVVHRMLKSNHAQTILCRCGGEAIWTRCQGYCKICIFEIGMLFFQFAKHFTLLKLCVLPMKRIYHSLIVFMY